jgi:adenylosuccinate synthase
MQSLYSYFSQKESSISISEKEMLKHIENINECPPELKAFIHKIEMFTGNKISLISYGPDRNQTFAL